MSPLSVFWRESRLTLLLAVPIMAGQLSQMLMGLLDSVMVGALGFVPLAASGFAGTLTSVPFVFGIGLLTCISVLVSQAQGAGRREDIGEILRHAMALALGVGAFLTLFLLVLSGFLDRFGQPPEVVRESRAFFVLLSLSVLPSLLALGLKGFCEALNRPWPPTLILLASVPLNALVNWLLIYGNLGFPALGLAGAGVGTLVARIAALGAIWWYLRREPAFHDVLPRKFWAPLNWNSMREQAKIGFPSGIHFGVEVAAFSIGAIFVGWLGARAGAAHQIAIQCAGATFMLPLGIGIATTIQVGNALGAGAFSRVRAIGWSSVILSVSMMIATALAFWLGGKTIAGAFNKDDLVVVLAAQLLVIAAIFQICDGVQITVVGALRGLSDTFWPMIFSLVGYWILGLPLGYFLAFRQEMGAPGIWLGFAFGLGFVSIFLSIRFGWRSKIAVLSRLKSAQND